MTGEQSKFNVGDKVRVVAQGLMAPQGLVFVVERVHDPVTIDRTRHGRFYYTGGGAWAGVWEQYLELVEPAGSVVPPPPGWFEGEGAVEALDRAHAYGVSWQREGGEVVGPAYLLEAVAAIRRLRERPDREAVAAAAAQADGYVLDALPFGTRQSYLRGADAVLSLFKTEAPR